MSNQEVVNYVQKRLKDGVEPLSRICEEVGDDSV